MHAHPSAKAILAIPTSLDGPSGVRRGNYPVFGRHYFFGGLGGFGFSVTVVVSVTVLVVFVVVVVVGGGVVVTTVVVVVG